MARLRYVVLTVAFLLAGAVAITFWSARPIDPTESLTRAREELAAGNPKGAERLAKQVLDAQPDSADALLIIARACVESGRGAEGLQYLDRLPELDDDDIVAGHLIAGRMHDERGQASLALRHFRQVVAVRPEQVDAHREIARLLTITGRRWESRESLVSLVKMAQANVEELELLGNLEVDFDVPDEVTRYIESAPNDLHPRLTRARYLFHRNQRVEARAMLAEITDAHPDFLEAQAWHGRTLVDKSELFAAWNATLPDSAEEHPLVWVARGIAASNNEQPRAAIRCFWEATRRDPNRQIAHYRLARLLRRYGDGSSSDVFRDRSLELAKLSAALMNLFPFRHRPEELAKRTGELTEVAGLCESLSRPWEAAAWYRVIDALDPQHDSARRATARLRKTLNGDFPETLPAANQIDLSSYPLPSWTNRTADQQPVRQSASTVVFQDLAQKVGIDFIYDNGHDPNELGMPIHQVTGGGVGVIDFDADGWPDVYLTQGGEWPAADHVQGKLDRLYRNLGGRFEDITLAAGLVETSFSQGIAVGDINSDGFADVYVANLGHNRLYLNQGDGTFAEAAEDTGLAGDHWTTSCLLADLNGDGLADIYDVNYVEHREVNINRLCDTDGLAKRTCPPRAFPAAQDRVLVNVGDGTFRDVTETSGIVSPLGYGLGIVAADFHGNGRLSLFVANDDSRNYWFVNETVEPGGVLSLIDQAEHVGVATDRDGKAQACMGIAAGDADGDGLLDLFVTNFYNQSNTLYYRRGEDWFDDWTIPAGLRNDSFAMLGFGTQFIDSELDGKLDLVLANGHVDDYSYKGFPFKMPAQFYRNRGRGRFHQVAAGPFFRQHRLGRGLARLDWNRDGLEDVVISHIGDPAALLTNRTSGAGHFFAIRLRGVRCNRDAIGTVVQAKVGGQTLVRQLTAGDGYQASNSRQLIIGLATNEVVEELIVRWPGQDPQRFADLSADIEWILVEGSEPLPLSAATGQADMPEGLKTD